MMNAYRTTATPSKRIKVSIPGAHSYLQDRKDTDASLKIVDYQLDVTQCDVGDGGNCITFRPSAAIMKEELQTLTENDALEKIAGEVYEAMKIAYNRGACAAVVEVVIRY